MNKDHVQDKIELTFHDDDPMELTILELLNKNSFKRGRETHIKNIIMKELKSTSNEEFSSIYAKHSKRIISQEKLDRIFD